MTLKEAAHQALKVLESSQYPQPQQRNAITALRQALEQADELTIDCPRCGHCCPQREWQGLTDEDIDELEGLHIRAARGAVDAWVEGVEDFVRAIEAALRSKNT